MIHVLGRLSIVPFLLLASEQPVSFAQTVAPEKKSTAPSGGLSQAQIEERLKIAQKSATKRGDFSVNFKQQVYSSLRNKVTDSQGKLEFKPPRQFRWEATGATKELFVSDGKDFWKYNAQTNHAQRLPPSAADKEFIDVLFNLGTLRQQYDISEWPAPDSEPKTQANVTKDDPLMSDMPPARKEGKLLVKLIPKAKSQQTLYLVVDEKLGLVDELRLSFKNGNRTRIVFDSLSQKPMEASRFTFTPPPGTAVDKLE